MNTKTQRVEVLSILTKSSLLIENLPELPGYNGSIRTIDDEEASRIGKELDQAHSAINELIEAARDVYQDYDGDIPFVHGIDRLQSALARIGGPA